MIFPSLPIRRSVSTLLLSAAVLAGAGGLAQAQTSAPGEDVLAFLTRHADRVSLVHYAVDADGRLDSQFPSISHRADLPLPLASTAKVILLATYAREVDAGRLDPTEPVTLGEWQTYYHPFFDTHAATLGNLGVATDPLGFALDPSATVPLDLIARVMIRESDNVATDYLLNRLGRESFEATVAAAELEGQESMYSTAGFLMTIANHEDGLATPERLNRLLSMDRETFVAEAERLASLYWENPTWRQEEILWQSATVPSAPPGMLAALTDVHNPRGIARDFARVLAQVVTGNFLSPTVSTLMRNHLEIPLAGTGLDQAFVAIGSKGGESEGTLTLARYSIPRVGSLAGVPVVSILFLNGIPSGLDVLQVLAEPAELFFLRLWLDETFPNLVRETLCTPDAETACLQRGRFRVRLSWSADNGQEGQGQVSPSSSVDSGLFYFRDPDNLEFLVKVLDGCGFNDHYWFFSAAATNVGYSMTVTDTALGVTQTYDRPAGPPAPAINDTAAFATCDDLAVE
ncbi:MAG: class A beta-lactamase-related serine hydrolase [Thermoanaerobaculia bacterium]|nr:class A beta-lactamase-related serine hydrolase [Thermoanaerobaculia bacterium]